MSVDSRLIKGMTRWRTRRHPQPDGTDRPHSPYRNGVDSVHADQAERAYPGAFRAARRGGAGERADRGAPDRFLGGFLEPPQEEQGRARRPGPYLPAFRHGLPRRTATFAVFAFRPGPVPSFIGPSGEFWFGTDDFGRDMWTRVWAGTRVSLYIALLAAALDLFVGVPFGAALPDFWVARWTASCSAPSRSSTASPTWWSPSSGWSFSSQGSSR